MKSYSVMKKSFTHQIDAYVFQVGNEWGLYQFLLEENHKVIWKKKTLFNQNYPFPPPYIVYGY